MADRVVLQSQYKLTPPVRLFREEAPPAPPGQPSGAADTELERQVLARGRERRSDGAEPASAEAVIRSTLQTYEQDADRLVSPGVSAEDARLASALLSDSSPDDAPAFAQNLAKLRTMGFAADVACGALLQTGNDLERASDVLLREAERT